MSSQPENYLEYCKLFTKTLKTCMNAYKGPCTAKDFDTLIDDFVMTLYNAEAHYKHPFDSTQDAYNFAYLMIFTITTNHCTFDEYKQFASKINVPDQFLYDMYEYVTKQRNVAKGLLEQAKASTERMRQTLSEYEIVKVNRQQEQDTQNAESVMLQNEHNARTKEVLENLSHAITEIDNLQPDKPACTIL